MLKSISFTSRSIDGKPLTLLQLRRDVWEKHSGPRDEIISTLASLPTDVTSSLVNQTLVVSSELMKAFYRFLESNHMCDDGDDGTPEEDFDPFSGILDEKIELSAMIQALRNHSNQTTQQKWKDKTMEDLGNHLTDIRKTVDLTVVEMDTIFSVQEDHTSKTLHAILAMLSRMSTTSTEWRY